MNEFNQHKAIADALRYLSNACDGARASDGAGFNKLDSVRGKSLWRDSSTRGLTVKQEEAALKLLAKYRTQLSHAGITLTPTAEHVP